MAQRNEIANQRARESVQRLLGKNPPVLPTVKIEESYSKKRAMSSISN
jgi:hypothetical protein